MGARKIVRQPTIIISAILAVLATIGLFVAHSQAFHRFLLSKVILQAEASTGARVEIRKMNIAWRPLTADFYGLAVRGSETNPEYPFFRPIMCASAYKLRPC